jgi:hypothetical protein
VRQLLQEKWSICAFLEVQAAHMLTMSVEILLDENQLLLLLLRCRRDAADLPGCNHGCLIQPAVSPSGTAQAAGVIKTTEQHCQQNVVWQLQ